MLLPIILASLASLIYANVGFKVGVDVGKNQFRKSLESGQVSRSDSQFFAFCIGLLAGVIWPLLIVTLASKRKKDKVLEETPVKMLPPPENQDSPVDTAEKLIALQEKRAQLEQGVSELGKQMDELKADPEIGKVLNLPKRL